MPSPRLVDLPQEGGREELRAAFLKPYLLRLRLLHDDEMVRALLATIGLPEGLLEDDKAWVSVDAARRALASLEHVLGGDALENHGEWMTHPESLHAQLRLLQAVSRPLDAYRYVCIHADRGTRIGSYELRELGPTSLRISYLPDEDDDSPQDDPLFCRARVGSLRALPRLFGLADAHVTESSCIARGDEACVYEVTWKETGRSRWVPIAAAAGGAILFSGATVALSGSLLAAGVSFLAGGALIGGLGEMVESGRRHRMTRIFQRHRIRALERGLELGDVRCMAPGDLSGTILGGKYRIVSPIGSGGSGAVYEAEHLGLGSRVAVKVLRGAAARNPSEVARLRREARVQGSIDHPNVLRIFDLDEMPDGSIYVVMELLRGESLAAKLARDTFLSPEVAVPAFLHVCRALASAHERGIVHRDMKPANVFLCDSGVAKVLDFGMSKFAAAEPLTREGHTLGTPEYMAPEQCTGAVVEPRTDVYSLGVLMYEALTGELPIRAKSRRELLELHPHQQPLPMRELRPDLPLPSWLDEAVMKALAKSPRDRPTAEELERMLGG